MCKMELVIAFSSHPETFCDHPLGVLLTEMQDPVAGPPKVHNTRSQQNF